MESYGYDTDHPLDWGVSSEELREKALRRGTMHEPNIPEGWTLVPRIHTIEMTVAFAEVWYAKRRAIDDHDMQDAYQAMISAAPKRHADCPPPVDETEAAERKHMGCAHCETGVYAHGKPAQGAREVLRELVDLQDIKLRMAKISTEPDYLDSIEKIVACDLLCNDYANRIPIAWQAARSILSTPHA